MAGRIVRKRCVLLLGKSGAGKSTMANHLVGHDPLSPDEPPFKVLNKVLASVTLEFQHETVEFMWENDLYRVTVVDTPGLFFPHGIDLTFDGIVQYIRETEMRINLILFVFKKGRFAQEEKAMFSLIMAKFRENHSAIAGCPKEISSISAVVVTGCENDDTTRQEELVQKFKVDSVTREIASQTGMGIYPVGFPNVKDFTNPILQQAYIPQMEKYRDTLKGLIARARPSSTNVKLTMANLTSLKTAERDNLKIIETIAPRWKTVGYLMDLDPDRRKVDVIEAEYAHKQNGVVTCCQEIFKLWLDREDATWEKLNELLNGSGHKVLAEQVMDAVGLL